MASVEREHVNLINPLEFGAACTEATLIAAIDAVDDAEVILVLTKTDRAKVVQPQWSIATSLTIPENITLYVPSGVNVVVATGATLTVNGYVRSDEPVWWQGNVVLNRVRWRDEKAYSDFFPPYVVSGGKHSIATGLVSGAFQTTAWLSNGIYKTENAAIDYTPFVTGGAGHAWVCMLESIQPLHGPWQQVGTTAYYVNNTAPRAGLQVWPIPDLPVGVGGVLLMAVKLDTGNIVRVDDYTWKSPGQRRIVNVMDCGAKGDGVTDDTAAFNIATGAFEVWNPNICRVIEYDSGRDYLLLGTVFIRAEQTLRASGLGSGRLIGDPSLALTTLDHPMFALGARPDSSTGLPVPDNPGSGPGGSESISFSAPTLENVHINVGPIGAGAVRTYMSGIMIRHCFFTNVDIAIHATSADLIISDIFIDQCLTGIVFENCQSVLASDLVLFIARHGIDIKGQVIDVSLNNVLIEYSWQYAIKVFQGSFLRNVSFSNLHVVWNEQRSDFIAGIQLDGPSPEIGDIGFHNCTFRNLPGPALLCSSGIMYTAHLTGWEVDGLKTHPIFAQSVKATGLIVQGATLNMRDMVFKNLYGPIISTLGNFAWNIRWNGGWVENLIWEDPEAENRCIYMPPETSTISQLYLSDINFGNVLAYNFDTLASVQVRNLTSWLGPIVVSGGRQYWQVAYSRGGTYLVSITVNPNASLGGQTALGYRKNAVYIVDVANLASTLNEPYHQVKATLLHTSETGPNASLPDLDVIFTLDGGGPTNPGEARNTRFFVSLPATYHLGHLSAQQLGFFLEADFDPAQP